MFRRRFRSQDRGGRRGGGNVFRLFRGGGRFVYRGLLFVLLALLGFGGLFGLFLRRRNFLRLCGREVAFGDVFLNGSHSVVAHCGNGREHGRHTVVRIAVRNDFAVHKLDYAGGVALGKLGIVRDHYDEPVVRDFLQKVHNLFGRFGVQRARGFVRKDDFGIVDDCPCDGDALHLTARHLVGFLFELTAESDAFERFGGEFFLFGTRNAGDGQRQLHVLQYVEVGDEVVGLKHETYRTVAVGVPVAGLELFGGPVVDNQVAVRVLVESAYDVEQCGLAAA